MFLERYGEGIDLEQCRSRAVVLKGRRRLTDRSSEVVSRAVKFHRASNSPKLPHFRHGGGTGT